MSDFESLDAKGLKVEKIFYSYQEPTITHGAFKLENGSEEMVSFSISQVRCLAGGDVIPIEEFFLYLLPEYEEQEPSGFELPPNSIQQYEVSFPPVSAAAYLRADVHIEVTLDQDGKTIKVLSPYEIIRRTPKSTR